MAGPADRPRTSPNRTATAVTPENLCMSSASLLRARPVAVRVAGLFRTRPRGFFARPRPTQDVAHAVVSLMACVFHELVLVVVSVEREHPRPLPRPDRGIVHGEAVLERRGGDAGVPLGQFQPAARPEKRCASIEVRRLDDERVTFPATLRIAKPQREAGSHVLAGSGGDDACLV